MSREIALRIACLQPADRDWVIDQMSAGERAHYEPLLADVFELGLHRDPAVLEALKESRPTPPAAPKILDGNIESLLLVDPFWQQALLGNIDLESRSAIIEQLGLDISPSQCKAAFPPSLYQSIHTAVLAQE